ncbi:MAG: DUF3006 domain-containing protein [Negativicutes bacterium]|nr:DUF3006 domain-containing protein [Negativicutes bacterium]
MLVKAVVDRLEGDKAVLLLGEDETAAVWPRQGLPPGVREGDILAVDLCRDEAATRQARAMAEDLLRQLTHKEEK